MAAAEALGVKMPPHFAHQLRAVFDLSLLSREFWTALARLLEPLLWPYTLGSLVGAVALAAAAFLVARPSIEAGRRHLHLHGHPPSQPPEAR
jgi:hypothetical protein